MSTETITILHTNDLHGHVLPWTGWEGDLAGRNVGGMGRLAAAVAAVRAECPEALLLDGGDTIGDTLEAVETEGAVVIAAMNAIGYDALSVGNHEPDFSAAVLQERRAEATFSFLAANLRNKDGSYAVRPYMMRTVGGVAVAILGLAYPNTPWTTSAKNVKGLIFEDAITTARSFVPRLRGLGADVVIVLAHLGLNHEKKLAENVPGIDVIVGGHSHNRMHEPIRSGSTLLVQAGAHGSDLGRLDLDFVDGKIVSSRRMLMPLTGAVRDERVEALVHDRIASMTAHGEEVVGRTASLIARAQTIAGGEPERRNAESPADSLFADIIRERTGADVAFLPGVGYGVALQAGPIRLTDLRQLVPHDSSIFTVRIDGVGIRSVLERSIQNVYTDDVREKVGGMIQISGLEFAYDPRRPFGRRILRAKVGAHPLDPERTYTAAINSLLSEGGHRYAQFEGKPKEERGKQADIIAAGLLERGVVSPPPPGRISKEE